MDGAGTVAVGWGGEGGRGAADSATLVELKKIDAQRAEMKGGHKPKGDPRASTTDPEARKMKMADGGFRPAYNVQLATDTESRVIVGAAITEDGTDYAHCAPMMEQIERRTGRKPDEVLVDGGFTSKESVDAVSKLSVTLYGPSGQRKGKNENPAPPWRGSPSGGGHRSVYRPVRRHRRRQRSSSPVERHRLPLHGEVVRQGRARRIDFDPENAAPG